MELQNKIHVPANALILLVGAAASGKSTFAAQHFSATEIISSDACRGFVSDDETNQSASGDAFDLFHFWIDIRLKRGHLTVADATNVRPQARAALIQIAMKQNRPVVAFRFNTPIARCIENNAKRMRYVPPNVIKMHDEHMQIARTAMDHEGYQTIHTINIDRKYEIIRTGVEANVATGYDVIGDLHGCYDEFVALLRKLGYRTMRKAGQPKLAWQHPEGRKIALVGDLTDRGPRNVDTLRLVMALLEDGHVAVEGNHDNKLKRALKGNKVRAAHGLAGTLLEIDAKCADPEKAALREMMESLPTELRLKVPGKADLIVCHAGQPRQMVGRTDNTANAHRLYGEADGKDDHGYPHRTYKWRASWTANEGDPVLVHGHDVVEDPYPETFINVVNVDQGCAFGGKLTAFRYPEGDVVQVESEYQYAERKVAA